MVRKGFWLAFVTFVGLQSASAQSPNPIDLVQGLRENGLSDLALDYLIEQQKKNPTGDLKVVLPLELAKTRLLLAQTESDAAVRDGIIAGAKKEFDAFLKNHPTHPRSAEASLALARVVSLQAKALLSRAYRIDTGAADAQDQAKVAEKKAAAAATRPMFQRASDLFGQGSKNIQAIIDDPATDIARKKSLVRDSMQAELERGINQFNLADAYISPEGQEAVQRGAALDAAKAIFLTLGKKDTNSPISWSARAWAAACDVEKTDTKAAEDAFKQIRIDATKSPASGDGVRMVEFFEAQNKYLQNRRGTVNEVRQAKTLVKNWLDKDKYRSRNTPERLSMTFYYASLSERESYDGIRFDKAKPPNITGIDGNARALLLEASREYKKLIEFDNEYSDRAGKARTRVIRTLVMGAGKKPTEYTTFEECQMAALVKLDAGSSMEPKERDVAMNEAIVLFERARQLVTPAIPIKDIADMNMMLAYAYLNGGRPYEAAILGEHLSQVQRGTTAAKAGLFAVEGYLASRAKLEDNDTKNRTVDRERAIRLSIVLDKNYPTDPSTDSVRFRLGRLYLEEKQYQEAFDILAKVNNSYSGASSARIAQGRAGYMLINNKDSALTPAQKAAVFQKAVTDIDSLPEPTGGPELKSYLSLRNLLAQLHLSNPPEGYAKAEQIAVAALASAAKSGLDDPDKKAAIFSAEEIRLRAAYAQAVGFYKAMKYKEMAEKMGPDLVAMKKSGLATDAKLEGDGGVIADNLDKFRREYIVLSLQGRIREGEIDKAKESFELLEQLGGSVDATTDALSRLVSLVRPQIDDLKKQSKPEEAAKLVELVASLLRSQAEKKLKPRAMASLGRSLRDLGVYDKAIETLLKVPVADNADLMKRTTDIADNDKREGAIAHQIAQIELARAYRATKQFDKADELLKAAMGTKEKPGWARALEYRREAIFLLEDKAQEAPADKRKLGWGEALRGWSAIATEYRNAIQAPIKGNPTPEERTRIIQNKQKLVPIFLELIVDEKRCLTKANSQLLQGKPELASAFGRIAQSLLDVERGDQQGLSLEVKTKFHMLLEEFPMLKGEYVKKGGKLFLDPDAQSETPAVLPAATDKK